MLLDIFGGAQLLLQHRCALLGMRLRRFQRLRTLPIVAADALLRWQCRAQIVPGLLVLPGVGHQLQMTGRVLLPAGLHAGQIARRLQQLLLGLLQRGLEFAQRVLRGGGVQRAVLRNRRVLVRAAQGTGLARLQTVAMLGEAANHLLLFEQQLLVRGLRGELRLQLLQSRDFWLGLGEVGGQLDAGRTQGAALLGDLALACRQVSELARRVELVLGLFALLAQRLHVERAEQFGLRGLQLKQLLIGLRLGRTRRVCRGRLRGELCLRGLQIDSDFRSRGLLRLNVFLRPKTLHELLAPHAVVLAQLRKMRMLCAPVVQRALFVFKGEKMGPSLRVDLRGQRLRVGMFAHPFHGLLALFILARVELVFCRNAGRARRLARRMKRLQRLCRLAGLQLGDLWRGRLQRRVGLGQSLLRALGRGGRVGELYAPLVVFAHRALFGHQLLLLRFESGDFRLQACALLVAQQLHAIGARLHERQSVSLFACAGEHAHGNLAVDFRPRELFQQLGALVGAGIQKRRKAALREQHRAREAREIEARDFSDALDFFVDVRGDDRAVTLGQFDPRLLQRTVDLVARAALAPQGAVDFAAHFELQLGTALGGVPRHDVVDRRGDRVQTRRLVVQRQADRIQQGGFARTSRPGDRKQIAFRERWLGEIDVELTLERVEVLEFETADFHCSPSVGVVTIWR